MTSIKVGDDVHHKSNLINGGQPFPVLEMKADQAKCMIRSSDPELGLQEVWFALSDLTLAKESDGGFKMAPAQ